LKILELCSKIFQINPYNAMQKAAPYP